MSAALAVGPVRLAGSPILVQDDVEAPGDARREAALSGLALSVAVPRSVHAPSALRHVVSGLVNGLGADPGVVADLRLAVTEVGTALCARRATGGRIALEAEVEDGRLRAVMRDEAPVDSGVGAVPVPLLVALTESVELRDLPAGGVEVAMAFGLHRA